MLIFNKIFRLDGYSISRFQEGFTNFFDLYNNFFNHLEMLDLELDLATHVEILHQMIHYLMVFGMDHLNEDLFENLMVDLHYFLFLDLYLIEDL